MVLVDTSAWIEWLIDSPTGAKVGEQLPEQTEWLAPTLVQLELAKWVTREAGEDKADQVIAFTQVCEVMPLDTEIALATADAIVFATARARDAALLTCDKHFDGLPGVILIEKIKA